MPIHEYRCEPCDRDFEALIRGRDDSPTCPNCGTTDVSKQFSVPAAARTDAPGRPLDALSARANPGPMAGGCGMGGCGMGRCGSG